MKPEFHNDIEFIQYPPPRTLKKAMESQWARQLTERGVTRLTNVLKYREPDPAKPDQSDPYEDIGIRIAQWVKCTVESSNLPFIWCCSSEKADSNRLLSIDPCYDTVILIHKPALLWERIRAALKSKVQLFHLQAGFVSYNKEEPGDGYYWGDNTFQKHRRYSYQEEYRFTMSEIPGHKGGRLVTPSLEAEPYIELELGPCDDIIAEQAR